MMTHATGCFARPLLMSLLCWCVLMGVALAEPATLTWTANTEADLAGYKVYQSDTAGAYGAALATLGKVTTWSTTLVPFVGRDRRVYFTITAFDTSGNESAKSLEVSKLVPMIVAFKSVTDTAGVKWHLVNAAAPYKIYRNDTVVTGMAVDLRIRNGIVEVLGTETTARNWYKWTGTAWTLSITEDTTPPAVPKGLVVASATPDAVVIIASVADCPRVLTSTTGSSGGVNRRTVRCVLK